MSIQSSPNLPNITLLATGGTIAGSSSSSTDSINYTAGSLSINSLLSSFPELSKYANLQGEQVSNIDSKDMTDSILLKLAKRCIFYSQQSDCSGIIITHGTDTLEETAYFLHLSVKTSKPIVLVGSMLPSTAISADGPGNLLSGLCVASSLHSHNRGVLVVFSGSIFNARDVTKISTSTLSSFGSSTGGAIGHVMGEELYFYNQTVKSYPLEDNFSFSTISSLPKVGIIYSHSGQSGEQIESLLSHNFSGIVYAGLGMGSIHKDVLPFLESAVSRGIAVVVTSRITGGLVPNNLFSLCSRGFISGNNLSAQKARILLQLSLTKSSDFSYLQTIFNSY